MNSRRITFLARNVSVPGAGRYNVIAVPAVGAALSGLRALSTLGSLADDGDPIDWGDIIGTATKGAADIIRASRTPAYPGYGFPGQPGYGYPGGVQVSAPGVGFAGINTTTLLLLGLGAAFVLSRR